MLVMLELREELLHFVDTEFAVDKFRLCVSAVMVKSYAKPILQMLFEGKY